MAKKKTSKSNKKSSTRKPTKRKSAKQSGSKSVKSTVRRKMGQPASLKFLKKTHAAIKSHMSAAMELPDFLSTAGVLSISDRRKLVQQAEILINGNFVRKLCRHPY